MLLFCNSGVEFPQIPPFVVKKTQTNLMSSERLLALTASKNGMFARKLRNTTAV
jgi:hypothetical protein